MSKIDAKSISRRGFLKRTGWSAVGVTVISTVALPLSGCVIPALPTRNDPVLEDGVAWVQALPDGRIRFFCPRMEMGQGATLGLCQIVAEELNVDQSQIDCVLPDTDQVPPFKMTVGSEGISKSFEPVSFGAALLREKLRKVAAAKEGLSEEQVKDGWGGFVLPSGTELGYGLLVSSEPIVLSTSDYKASGQEVPRYAFQRKTDFQAIGQSWKHHDLQAIVTGQAVYSRDVSVPDTLYGQVLHPPAFGAQLLGIEDRAAAAMRGVTLVVVDKTAGFIGVVAENPFVLSEAMEALDVQWEVPEDLNQDKIDADLDVEQLRARNNFEHTLASEGDISAGKGTAQYQTVARYDTSFAAHAANLPSDVPAR